MHINYLLWTKLESFWQGWQKTSKKPYFQCGPSSRKSAKNLKKYKIIKKQMLNKRDVKRLLKIRYDTKRLGENCKKLRFCRK